MFKAVILLACMGFILRVYVPALHIGFLSDDYIFLAMDKSISKYLVPAVRTFRYSPLGMLLFKGLVACFGHQPTAIRLVYLIMYLATAVLLYRLAYLLKGNAGLALLCVLLFVSFAFSYEVLYWLSAAIFYVPLVLLFLLGCVLFARYRANMPWIVMGIILLAYGLMLGFHEAGITFLLVLPACYGLCPRKAGNCNKDKVYLLFFGLAFITVLFVFAAMHFTKMLEKQSPSVIQMAHNMLQYNRYALSIAKLGQDNMVIATLSLGTVLLLSLAALKRQKLLLLLLIIMELTFILFAASGLQARYFYLGSCFFSTWLVFAGHAVYTWFADHRRHSFRRLATSVLLLMVVLLGARVLYHADYARQRLHEWQLASSINDKVTRKVADYFRKNPQTKEIVLLNLPDSIGSRRWPAYVFRNGLHCNLDVTCKNLNEKVKISYIIDSKMSKMKRYVAKLAQNKDGRAVFIYDKTQSCLRLLSTTEEIDSLYNHTKPKT